MHCVCVDDAFLKLLRQQIFPGWVSFQYQACLYAVRLISGLDSACIRFVYFSSEEEVRSKVRKQNRMNTLMHVVDMSSQRAPCCCFWNNEVDCVLTYCATACRVSRVWVPRVMVLFWLLFPILSLHMISCPCSLCKISKWGPKYFLFIFSE